MSAVVIDFWDADRVLALNAQTFYQTAADLQVIRSVVSENGKNGVDLNTLMTEDDLSVLKGLIAQLAGEVRKFPACKAAIASVSKLEIGAEAKALTYSGVLKLIEEIDGRLRDELAGTVSFCLNDFEASYFHLTRPLFNDESFEERFPSLIYDLEEAGKCFALERFTASAFHMIRALEIVLLSIARCAGASEPEKPIDRTWGALLKALKIEMDAKWPTAADRMRGDGQFFDELYVTLDVLKNPIRNATAHPHHRFDMIEAYDLLRNGGSLIRKINSRCDERGVPKVRKR